MKLARRDRVAATLANGILRLLATKDYRSMVRGLLDYGMRSSMRDDLEGKRPPPSMARLYELLARKRAGARAADGTRRLARRRGPAE